MPKGDIEIDIQCKGLDEAIEKVNQLNRLLEEAKQLIDSLSNESNKTKKAVEREHMIERPGKHLWDKLE